MDNNFPLLVLFLFAPLNGKEFTTAKNFFEFI
jgi:hypothetical protein